MKYILIIFIFASFVFAQTAQSIAPAATSTLSVAPERNTEERDAAMNESGYGEQKELAIEVPATSFSPDGSTINYAPERNTEELDAAMNESGYGEQKELAIEVPATSFSPDGSTINYAPEPNTEELDEMRPIVR